MTHLSRALSLLSLALAAGLSTMLAGCADLQPYAAGATLTPPATAEAEKNPCIITGCSSQLCVANTPANRQVAGTCEYRPTYACYARVGTCAVQTTGTNKGQCAWSETPALRACLKNPPPNKI